MRYLLIILIIAIAFLILAEYTVRFAFPEYKSLNHGRGITGGIKFSLNSIGLRDYEFKPLGKAGSIRIMAVGDSITFGCQNDFEDTYVKQLEKMINSDSHKISQVINCGLITNFGVGTNIEYYGIVNSIDKVNPDILILGFCLNDVGNVYFSESLPNLKDFTLTNAPYQSSLEKMTADNNTFKYKMNILRWKLRKSSLISLIDAKVSEFLYKTGIKKYTFSLYKEREEMLAFGILPESGAAWEMTCGYIEKIRDLLKGKKIKFLIVAFPFQFQVGENFFNIDMAQFRLDPQKVLADFCEKKSIALLDLAPYFKNSKEKLYFPLDYAHPTPYGNAIAAREIYLKLKELNYIE